MFGFFKKDGLSGALEECQQYHKRLDLGQELTESQVISIKSMDLYKDIDARYKIKGLTKYGGLAWFLAQTVGNVAQAINAGNSFSPPALDLIEKLVYVSLAIGNSIPELKLTKADMGPIENACQVAIQWIEHNPHPLDSELSSLMNR